MYGNSARPRACFTLWLTCHGKLTTKDHLFRFGMTANMECCFCSGIELINHLFFECLTTRKIWIEILEWIQIQHNPEDWLKEMKWITHQTKGKSGKAVILKMAVTQTLHEIWNKRNNKNFGDSTDNTNIGREIIDTLVYRGWNNKKIMKYIAILMLEE